MKWLRPMAPDKMHANLLAHYRPEAEPILQPGEELLTALHGVEVGMGAPDVPKHLMPSGKKIFGRGRGSNRAPTPSDGWWATTAGDLTLADRVAQSRMPKDGTTRMHLMAVLLLTNQRFIMGKTSKVSLFKSAQEVLWECPRHLVVGARELKKKNYVEVGFADGSTVVILCDDESRTAVLINGLLSPQAGMS